MNESVGRSVGRSVDTHLLVRIKFIFIHTLNATVGSIAQWLDRLSSKTGGRGFDHHWSLLL